MTSDVVMVVPMAVAIFVVVVMVVVVVVVRMGLVLKPAPDIGDLGSRRRKDRRRRDRPGPPFPCRRR